VASLIQKKMQTLPKNKGLTFLVMNDNKAGMPALSDAIYAADPWFDGLYQIRARVRGKSVWLPRTPDDRFNQIINTALRSNPTTRPWSRSRMRSPMYTDATSNSGRSKKPMKGKRHCTKNWLG
jgi:hypothetical protein